MGRKVCLFLSDDIVEKIDKLPRGRKSAFVEVSVMEFLKSDRGQEVFRALSGNEPMGSGPSITKETLLKNKDFV